MLPTILISCYFCSVAGRRGALDKGMKKSVAAGQREDTEKGGTG